MLAEELNALNAQNISIIKRAVVCDYNLELLYRCNLELRTCLKVLVPVFEFESDSPDDLYNFATRISWEDYMDIDQNFAIDFTIQSEYFKHSQFITKVNVRTSTPKIRIFFLIYISIETK